MKSLSEKIYLELNIPDSNDTTGDKDRILNFLNAKYKNVIMPYNITKSLYPLCRNNNFKITVTMVKRENDWIITRIEENDTTNEHYGLAVDLGSTTIIMQLINLNNGYIISEESVFNKQIKYGDDILSRIFYTKENKYGLEEIKNITIESLKELLSSLENKTNIHVRECPIMTIAGNTTMIHFLLGLDPWTIFQYPFTPVLNDCGFIYGKDLDLPINGYVYCFPSVANYLGGDIISGLLYTGIHKKDKLSAFIDIGTNGELVIGNKDFLVAAAGAAGPALEGGISKYGMRATTGAIDSIKIINNKIIYTTINNEKPKGICGSGIVDLISELFLNKCIDFAGTLLPNNSPSIIKFENDYAVEYVSQEESFNGISLTFTQNDIKQFLKTKAAANTMVAYLLEEIGLDINDLDLFYIAGAFGTHLNLNAAITIGIYPDLESNKIICPGNTSLKGAYNLLTNRYLLNDIYEIKNNIEYLQLSNATDFVEKMRAASFLPHTNLDSYPSVKKELIKRNIIKY
ncbi:methylamine methyltransferase corrinoid protein reductive activase [uncultured Clostridium sp.]|nr:methylamine methyltransferase corrinoid protein reductive activase [uncultured Clostridium sp.]